MSISSELKKLIRIGDYAMIAESYKERHELAGDFKTVTGQYVQMVIDGVRDANPGTAAEEIMMIAKKYLEHKRDFIDEMLEAPLPEHPSEFSETR